MPHIEPTEHSSSFPVMKIGDFVYLGLERELIKCIQFINIVLYFSDLSYDIIHLFMAYYFLEKIMFLFHIIGLCLLCYKLIKGDFFFHSSLYCGTLHVVDYAFFPFFLLHPKIGFQSSISKTHLKKYTETSWRKYKESEGAQVYNRTYLLSSKSKISVGFLENTIQGETQSIQCPEDPPEPAT